MLWSLVSTHGQLKYSTLSEGNGVDFDGFVGFEGVVATFGFNFLGMCLPMRDEGLRPTNEL